MDIFSDLHLFNEDTVFYQANAYLNVFFPHVFYVVVYGAEKLV